VLARLDEIDGVAESRVDWTGTRVLVTLNADADKSRVETEVESALGEGAHVLDERATREVLESYRKGEAWMRSGETLKLSRFEAGVLAKKHGTAAAAELGLDDATTQKLVALIEGELDRAFERAHAEGGIDALGGEIAAAGERIVEASGAFLDAEQRKALSAYIERMHAARGR
jgi:hypothetical protein